MAGERHFQIVVPVHGRHEVTERYLGSWFALAARPLDLLILDNGSAEPVAEQAFIEGWRRGGHRVRVVRNATNTGVYPTFQQGFDATDAPWIYYTHNDVEMRVEGWDDQLEWLLHALERGANPGICGMFGARGLGTPDIYRAPYDFRQMVRWECTTVASMTFAGGKTIAGQAHRVAVLDGFALIVRRRMVEQALGGRFDHERFPVHHMYDHDICLESHYGGFENYVINLDCFHDGGQTSKDGQWAEAMGTTDRQIHRRAHVVFYEKWRGRLPVSVP